MTNGNFSPQDIKALSYNIFFSTDDRDENVLLKEGTARDFLKIFRKYQKLSLSLRPDYDLLLTPEIATQFIGEIEHLGILIDFIICWTTNPNIPNSYYENPLYLRVYEDGLRKSKLHDSHTYEKARKIIKEGLLPDTTWVSVQFINY